MFKIRFKKKGVVLFIVLGMLLVVVSLATVILSLILSHARLTYHQTSRIQAYYAVLAGMNLARENLRNGTWTTGTYHLCKSGCSSPPDVNDWDIPYPVTITIGALGTSIDGVGRKIDLTVTYTYTAP